MILIVMSVTVLAVHSLTRRSCFEKKTERSDRDLILSRVDDTIRWQL